MELGRDGSQASLLYNVFFLKMRAWRQKSSVLPRCFSLSFAPRWTCCLSTHERSMELNILLRSLYQPGGSCTPQISHCIIKVCASLCRVTLAITLILLFRLFMLCSPCHPDQEGAEAAAYTGRTLATKIFLWVSITGLPNALQNDNMPWCGRDGAGGLLPC